MFIATIINKEQYRYNYGRKASQTRLKRANIKLPIKQDGQPDFEFMENYIKTLPYLDKENIKPLERGEFWICSGDNAKIYPIAMNAPVNLYQNYYCIETDFPKGF